MFQNAFDITGIMAWFAYAICHYCKFGQSYNMSNTFSMNRITIQTSSSEYLFGLPYISTSSVQ